MTERVVVFVDGPNLSAASHDHGVRIDFQKLLHELVGERELVETHYFDSVHDHNREKKRGFHGFLSAIGVNVYASPFAKEVGPGEWKEKGVDVALATKMAIGAAQDSYDSAILVAGDLDYFPALFEIGILGKSVEVAFFQDSASSLLRGAIADRFVDLGALVDRIRSEGEGNLDSTSQDP